MLSWSPSDLLFEENENRSYWNCQYRRYPCPKVECRRTQSFGREFKTSGSRQAFANEIGATAVDTSGAVEGADVVVISIRFAAVAELPKDLFDTVPQAVPVIDTGNVFEPLYQALYPDWSARVT
jgi:prephenate dehydrogenase